MTDHGSCRADAGDGGGTGGGGEPPAGRCITCADLAEEMTVLALCSDPGLALCLDSEGERHTVETGLLEQVAVHQRILVHAGAAIARVTIGAPA
jgi:hypothetical protein